MNKLFFSKVSIVWKIVFVLVSISVFFVASLGGLFFKLYSQVSVYQLDQSFVSFFLESLIQIAILFLLALGVVLGLFGREVYLFATKINFILKGALSEQKLEASFEDFYLAKSFSEISANVQALFSLFKGFDYMRASKVTVETTSSKLILNNVSEGILIANKEKVVVQINHPAEMMLRLIPGEIVGQTISRKISNPEILDNLDKALEEDVKVSNEKMVLSDEKTLMVSIHPIKNKYSEVVRAIIILKDGDKKA